MKLNINSKELLALHNLLRDSTTYERPSYPGSDDDVQLSQLYNRVKACLIAALSGKHVIDPIETFMSHEKQKIDRLRDGIDDVKKQQGDLANILSNDKDFIVPQRGDDFEAPEYPRRSQRRSSGHSRPKK